MGGAGDEGASEFTDAPIGVEEQFLHSCRTDPHAPPRGGVKCNAQEDLRESGGLTRGRQPLSCSDNGPDKLGPSMPKAVDLSLPKWGAMLASLVLQTRTPFSAYLASTIRLSRLPRNDAKPTPAFFPYPYTIEWCIRKDACKGLC